jgi:hypothetical protein
MLLIAKIYKYVSNFMKFEYGVTNGECVDKKKFGGQNLKKRQIVRRVLHTCRVPAHKHTANQALPCA